MIDQIKQHPFFKDKQLESCTLVDMQGLCNTNYILVADDKKYIVRKLVRTDIDRNFEYKIQELAYNEGTTAEPLIFDEKNGFMVFEFLEGVHKSILDKNDLKHLAKTLSQLHSIEIDAKPIEIHIENKTDEVVSAFETIDKYNKEYVLCHNDLNPQNILFSTDIKLIDWEYAGVNDKYFDLACVGVEFGLDEKDEDYFLSSYCSKEMIVYEKLEAYKTIYIALCKQWFEKN